MGRKSLNKNRKPITKKVKQWLEKLLLELQDKDLEKLTIDDLALLADKSKSTIYIYFESKEEIIIAICNIRVETITESIAQAFQQELDTIKLYESLVQQFTEGTAGISISFLQSIKQNYPSAWAIVENFTDIFIDLLKAQYNKGIEEGIFNDIPVDLMSHLDKIFVMQVVTNPTLFNDKTYKTSALIQDYLNLRLTGLLKR